YGQPGKDQVLQMVTADGKKYTFGRDDKGDVNEIRYPGGDVWKRTGPDEWSGTRSDGTKFARPWNGKIEFDGSGNLVEVHLPSNRREVFLTDGSRGTVTADGKVLSLLKRDGSGFLTTEVNERERIEQKNKDGTSITRDEFGRVLKAKDVTGFVREFQYDND